MAAKPRGGGAGTAVGARCATSGGRTAVSAAPFHSKAVTTLPALPQAAIAPVAPEPWAAPVLRDAAHENHGSDTGSGSYFFGGSSDSVDVRMNPGYVRSPLHASGDDESALRRAASSASGCGSPGARSPRFFAVGTPDGYNPASRCVKDVRTRASRLVGHGRSSSSHRSADTAARGPQPCSPARKLRQQRTSSSGSKQGNGAPCAVNLSPQCCSTWIVPLAAFVAGIVATSFVANEVTTGMADTNEQGPWSSFVRQNVYGAVDRSVSNLELWARYVRSNIMWLPSAELADPAMKIDGWLNKALLETGGSIDSLVFARHVQKSNVEFVYENLDRRYGSPQRVLHDTCRRGHFCLRPYENAITQASSTGSVIAAAPSPKGSGSEGLGRSVAVLMPVYLPSEEAAATVRDAESQPEELSRAYESVVADGASTFGTLALALDDTSIAAMLSPLIGVGGIGASERDERWIVVMEDVSAPETSESVIKRAGLPSGWTESVETDEHEADRRLCGTGGQLVWTNADAENSVDACAQLHSKPQQIRRTLNFYGRLWVCHAAGPPPQQPPLSSVARATRIIAWVVGGALSILLAIAAAHVVVECLTHKSREVEQSLMRAAEAAQTAHEETVSYACHELRNPLHVVSATAEFLFDELLALRSGMEAGADATAVESATEDVRTIVKSGCLMQAVVDDMLDYARLRRGQLDIVPTVVDIRGLVSGLLAAHRAMAKVPLVDSVVKSVPTHCYLDELRLRQVLQNGITNACKYVEEGSITLRVRLTSDRAGVSPFQPDRPTAPCLEEGGEDSGECGYDIESGGRTLSGAAASRLSSPFEGSRISERRRQRSLRARRSTSSIVSGVSEVGSSVYAYVVFEVIDTGPGLRGANAEKLFQPFEQGEGAKLLRQQNKRARSDRAQAGTGLGLAIAYQLVTLMGGQIGLEDREDRSGTRFWFSLPIFAIHDESDAQELPGSDSGDSSGFASERHALDRGRSTLSTCISAASDSSDQAHGHTQVVSLPSPASKTESAVAPVSTPSPPATVSAAERARRQAVYAGRAAVKGWHFLVVDDERANRRIAGRFLKVLGATAAELADGDEVVSHIKRHHADAFSGTTKSSRQKFSRLDGIFMDIAMARSNGEEILMELRTRGFQGPVFACTGNASAANVARYRSVGFTSVLTKPFSAADMASVLTEAISVRRMANGATARR